MQLMGRCGYCQKLVRDKPIFGTLHICLTPEEIALIKYERAQVRHQIEGQKRMIREGSILPRPLSDRMNVGE